MKGELPEGWCKTTIGEAFFLTLGQSPPSTTYNSDGEGLPFFQGKAEFGEIYPITIKWCSRPKKIAEKGDVLLSVRAPVGPTNIAPKKCCIGRGLASIRPIAGLDTKFILYYFRSVERYLSKSGTGTTFNAITGNALKNLPFLLPPLPEQNRIVTKIEELFTKLDAGIEALKKAKEQLKRYRQSVLKAAVEGRLTKEWREKHKDELEPADKLLERILKERRDKWGIEQLAKYKSTGEKPPKDLQDKYKEPNPPDTSNIQKIPKGWNWVIMNTISLKITDGEHIRPKMVKKGIPFLSAKDVQEEGIIFDGKLYINQADASRFWKRCNPELNDILIVSRGATVGRSCIIKTDKKFCLLGSVILIKLSKILLSKYISYMLKSSTIQKKMTNLSGSTAQQAIYIRDIKNLLIPVAPLLEQKIIVDKLERIFSNIKELESIINAELKRAQSLRQSILKRAFEGKLVPQDPNDEPASVLLERIKSEKAKSNQSQRQEKS